MVDNPHVQMTVGCSECGARKAEVNHWWIVNLSGESLSCKPFVMEGLSNTDQPVCGLECAQKKFEKFLQAKVRAA